MNMPNRNTRFRTMVCGILFATASPLPAQSGRLVLLHTNDMHAQFEPVPAAWVQTDPKPLIGGMAALSGAVASVRSEGAPVLLLDGGDILTGTPLSDMVIHGVKGGGFVELMNAVGYDAMVIGNHEFDNGPDNLKKLFDLADFDVLSANLFYGDTLLAPKAWAVYRKGSLRVGVIGLSPPFLYDVAAHKQLKGIRVTDDPVAVQRLIDRLDPETDLIVLLTHQGVLGDMELAKKLHGADIIVGGHSHTRLPDMVRVNHMLILQTGSRAENLGRLELTVKGDTLSEYRYRLMPLWVDSLPPDPLVASRVREYQQEIKTEYGHIIGTLKSDWVRNHSKESNIGNFITDAMRKAADADFALINSGGIRKNLSAGPIRKLDIVEILPFSNTLMTFPCTGRQLLRLMETNAKASAAHRGILQVSGISYAWTRAKEDEVHIQDARIQGNPVHPDSMYTGVTVDYVLEGNAERYMGFVPDSRENLGILVSEAVIRTVRSCGPIDSRVEGRMRSR